jgi:hypothetical protein
MTTKQNEQMVPARPATIARLDPQVLLENAISSNAGVETMERLVALAKDVQAQQARIAWHDAMAEFQRKCPRIMRTETADIKTARGSYSYKWAPLDQILKTVTPVLSDNGLNISWRTRFEGNKAIATCRIAHRLGHSEESGEVAIQLPGGEMGANEPQRVGIAMTYARRYAVLSILGIAPEDDPDAAVPEKPTVQRPRRSEPPPAVDTTATETWEGIIKSVTQKNGVSGGKEWTLWVVAGVDGMEFGTFEQKDAEVALNLTGQHAIIDWQTTPKGSRKITAIVGTPDEG